MPTKEPMYTVLELIGDCYHRVNTKQRKRSDVKKDDQGYYREGEIVYLVHWAGDNPETGEPWPHTFESFKNVAHLDDILMNYELNRALVAQQKIDLCSEDTMDDSDTSSINQKRSSVKAKSKSPSSSSSLSLSPSSNSKSKKKHRSSKRRDRRNLEEKAADREKEMDAEESGLELFQKQRHIRFEPWKRGYLYKERDEDEMDIAKVCELLSDSVFEEMIRRLKSMIKKMKQTLLEKWMESNVPELMELAESEIKQRSSKRSSNSSTPSSSSKNNTDDISSLKNNKSGLRRSERQRKKKERMDIEEEQRRQLKREARRKRKREYYMEEDDQVSSEEDDDLDDSRDDSSDVSSDDDKKSIIGESYENAAHYPKRKRRRRQRSDRNGTDKRDSNSVTMNLDALLSERVNPDRIDRRYRHNIEPVIERCLKNLSKCYIEMDLSESLMNSIRKHHLKNQKNAQKHLDQARAFLQERLPMNNDSNNDGNGDNNNNDNPSEKNDGNSNEDSKNSANPTSSSMMTVDTDREAMISRSVELLKIRARGYAEARRAFRPYGRDLSILNKALQPIREIPVLNIEEVENDGELVDLFGLRETTVAEDGRGGSSDPDSQIREDSRTESVRSSGGSRILKKKQQSCSVDSNLVATFPDHQSNSQNDNNAEDDLDVTMEVDSDSKKTEDKSKNDESNMDIENEGSVQVVSD